MICSLKGNGSPLGKRQLTKTPGTAVVRQSEYALPVGVLILPRDLSPITVNRLGEGIKNKTGK